MKFMETLLNTDFFLIIKNYSSDKNSENIFLAYKKFVKTLIALLQNTEDSKYIYFLIKFTRMELLEMQEVENSSNTGKKMRL